MVAGSRLDGSVDIERLEVYLLSDNAPNAAMGLSDMDGFLTGIAAGPELIKPSEWLPVLWGHEEPGFESIEEAQAIVGIILGRYNEIVGNITAAQPTLDPIFMGSPDGEVMIVGDWAAGFLDAVKLRPKAWAPLIADEESRLYLLPFLIHGGEPEDAALLGIPFQPVDAAEQRRLMPIAPDALICFTLAIWGYWSQHDTPATPATKPASARRSGGDNRRTRR